MVAHSIDLTTGYCQVHEDMCGPELDDAALRANATPAEQAELERREQPGDQPCVHPPCHVPVRRYGGKWRHIYPAATDHIPRPAPNDAKPWGDMEDHR